MVRIALEAMAETAGVSGCALVDADTGMVWHAAGRVASLVPFAEAAVDFWRLRTRLEPTLDPMGEVQAIVVVHSRQRLSIVGCGPDLLLVAVSGRDARIDWLAWQQRVTEIRDLAAAF